MTNQAISDSFGTVEGGTRELAVDASGVSIASPIKCSGANRIRFVVSVGSGSWGSTVLKVRGSIDGVEWVNFDERIAQPGMTDVYVFECLQFIDVRVQTSSGTGDGVISVQSFLSQEPHVPATNVEKWKTGDIKHTIAAVPGGWLELDGSTIGNASSGADHESDDLQALFEIVKDLGPNAGTESWISGDTVTLPDARRRALVGAGGTGTATLGSSVGSTGGAETHTLSEAEMPAHTHELNVAFGSGGVSQFSFGAQIEVSGNQDTLSAGGDGAHNNIQPSLVTRVIVKV